MTDPAFLFALQQETSRALAIVEEYREEAQAADQGPGLPSIAAERARAADDALRRLVVRFEGVRFQLKRGALEYGSRKDSAA